MKTTNQRKRSYHFGLHAEKLSCWYLRAKGYRIIAERYRNHQGEIDIVAAKGRLLIAVEVKARNSLRACEDSITPWKRQKIQRAMQGLLANQHSIGGKRIVLEALHERDIRFDVIWIVPWLWPRHLKDAWRD